MWWKMGLLVFIGLIVIVGIMANMFLQSPIGQFMYSCYHRSDCNAICSSTKGGGGLTGTVSLEDFVHLENQTKVQEVQSNALSTAVAGSYEMLKHAAKNMNTLNRKVSKLEERIQLLEAKEEEDFLVCLDKEMEQVIQKEEIYDDYEIVEKKKKEEEEKNGGNSEECQVDQIDQVSAHEESAFNVILPVPDADIVASMSIEDDSESSKKEEYNGIEQTNHDVICSDEIEKVEENEKEKQPSEQQDIMLMNNSLTSSSVSKHIYSKNSLMSKKSSRVREIAEEVIASSGGPPPFTSELETMSKAELVELVLDRQKQ